MSNSFSIGEEVSRAKIVSFLETIRRQGQSVLDLLTDTRLGRLLEFERRLSAINTRRQRSYRLPTADVAVRFVVSDFGGIDQSITTATVRVDSRSATLRERSLPADITIRSQTFTSSTGTVEAVDAKASIFSVHLDDNQLGTPVGTFDIELATALDLSLLIFDIVATPSLPEISVKISSNGVTFINALDVSLNGYRVNAWFAPATIRFVRISISPTHPDSLSGNIYTFGITSFSAVQSQFQLKSELFTRPVTFVPNGVSLVLKAPVDPALSYFLSLTAAGSAVAPYVETSSGQVIAIPGAVKTVTSGVGFVSSNFTPRTVVSLGTILRPITQTGLVYKVTTAGTTQGVTISTVSRVGGTSVTTVVTSTPHGLSLGAILLISGVIDTSFNGNWIVASVVNPTTLTFANPGPTASSSGGGLSGEPVWPLTQGSTVTSGTAILTAVQDGLLGITLPTNIYPNTLQVTEDGFNTVVPIAPGLTNADTRIPKLINKYIGVVGQSLLLCRADIAVDIGKTYTVSYISGPASVDARLRIQMLAVDRTVTPIFTGATLENA